MVKKFSLLILLVVVLGTLAYGWYASNNSGKKTILGQSKPVKLYWFIPDGVRAEPSLFTVFKWAEEGKLPNIKKLMESGSYGYSYPNFPSHTPTNFAALLTGSYPEVNGVNDGPMHVIGKPLDKVAIPGFRSSAKKVSPIWTTLEEAGYKVAILSVPGSTPPEIEKGVVLRGRWGGWGADFPAIMFETKGDLSQRVKQGRAARFFYFGPQLTQYIDSTVAAGWTNPPQSFSEPKEITFNQYGAVIYGYMYDSTDDQVGNYDKIAFSFDKKTAFSTLSQGQWSQWAPLTLQWESGEMKTSVDSKVKIAVNKIGEDGFFRVRLVFDNLNKHLSMPESAAAAMEEELGPMIDFVDNFPPQLVYYPEDKNIFLDEMGMTFSWHTGAVGALVEKFSPDVVIHDIYSPNQMLTSRWWMGYVDPKSTRYGDVSESERAQLWSEVQDMYVKLDNMVGEILKNTNEQSYVVFSSDHGNVPLNKSVNLNNVFAKKGWLSFEIDPKTGEPIIDWKKSQVIYLKMAHVYINPNGLAGDYQRASGPAYEKLRNEVIATLRELTDEDGSKPLDDVVTWENAKQYLQMDPDRAGDLIIANSPGYGWNEEMTKDLATFSEPLVTGYKQAIIAKNDPGMWTPFIIAGPGIKKNHFLGEEPFSLVNQYPTIMKALGLEIPDFVQGKPLEVFE